MKLLELFDTEIKSKPINGMFDINKDRKLTKTRQLNYQTGYHGYVKPSGDPHLIKKRPNIASELKSDGYYQYIKYVVENKLAQTNPYFPRVYKFKTFSDTTGYQKYSIELEKLEELDSISKEDLYIIGDRMYYNFDEIINEYSNKLDDLDSSDLAYVIALFDRIEIKDEYLREALNVINKISNNTKTAVDIHIGNIMVRRGPYGVQLVITDPLS